MQPCGTAIIRASSCRSVLVSSQRLRTRWNVTSLKFRSTSEKVNCVFRIFDSPIGRLKLVARDSALVAILWVPDRPGRVDPGPMDWDGEHPVLLETERQLRQYFAGDRSSFNLPVDISQLTSFQRSVLDVACRIAPGQVWTYHRVAAELGRPRSSRPVGGALARNPIPIVIPCHRVVASDGSLGGYSGGSGLKAKRWLLRLEGAL